MIRNNLPPDCKGFLHKVRSGETLYTLAKKNGVTLQEIIGANPQIKNPNNLEVGQYVCIPQRGRKTTIYSTGPLAIDPVIQTFIGVIVENNTSVDIQATVLLFDKDPCPKISVFKLLLNIPSGCAITPFFDILGFFYEVQVEVPALPGILVAAYGLTEQFGVVAANTLRHSELIILAEPPKITNFARNTATLTAPSGTKQWVRTIE